MGEEDSTRYILENKLRDTSSEATNLPLSLLNKITKHFSDKQEIGRGGFGVVYKGVLRNGMMVAVKKLADSNIDDRLFKEEVSCLMRTKHKNVVRFLGYCADTQGIMTPYEGKLILADRRVRLLCFEYLGNGSLESHLSDESSGLEWHQRYRIIKGICQGLRYLHEEQKIIHLDLKPANVLLDQNNKPKITDFGLSRLFSSKKTQINTNNCPGTLGYMAPELFQGIITLQADIYSLGMIILKVIIGTMETLQIEDVCENWKKRLQQTLTHTSSVEPYCKQVKRCLEIALTCAESDRHKRPSIGQIVNMLNETETGCLDLSTVALSLPTDLLGIHPLELRFRFQPNKLIPCSLHLTNSTDHRIAFRLQPSNTERYFTEWLCGVVPPRSSYTLVVTMKGQERPSLEADEFLLQQSSMRDDDELQVISQGKADAEYGNFFAVQEVDKLHELTLTAAYDPQAQISSEILYTMHFEKMVTMDVHPTKPWIITGHYNGHICIWDYETKILVNSFEVTRKHEVLTAKFIAKMQWVVAGGRDGHIYVYNYDTMKEVKRFKALTEQITSLAIHPTKPYVLSVSYDFEIKLWDWENGWRCAQIFKEEHTSSVMQVAFNPKNTSFASVSKDNTLKICSVGSPCSDLTFVGHSSNVRCLDYFDRGDKQYIITGSDDGTAKIWDLQKKHCVKTLSGHANRVSAVCSHHELPILMTGSRDGTVRIWNSNTFKLEHVLNFGLRKVYALGCIKGSKRVVIGHSYGITIMEVSH